MFNRAEGNIDTHFSSLRISQKARCVGMMRKAASKQGRNLNARPSLDTIPMHKWFAVLQPFWGLRNEEAFGDLTVLLFEYSCRDQEGEPTDQHPRKEDLAERRKAGFKAAATMRDNAAAMIRSLDEIHDAMRAFDEAVRWHPPLLEAILDVDTGGPGNILIPEAIEILPNFFRETDWNAAAEALTKLAALPVKAKRTTGSVPNTTLQRAVAACRTYWEGEDRSWSMSSLTFKSTRGSSNPDLLQGECETFVADLLIRSGIRCLPFQALSTAWKAVDKAGHSAKSQS